MTDTALTAAAEPDGAPRLLALDVLRGVAILGILFMNIADMGGSLYAFFAGDVRRPGWSGADQAAWWLREVLANGTARGLLEMLFGAGMVILTDRAATRMGEWQVLRGYAWRQLVLFLFGVVHVVVLLWPGDILHSYALAALVAMGFRNLRPRLLIVIGLALATLQLAGVTSYVVAIDMECAAVERIEAEGAPRTPVERKRVVDWRKAGADRAQHRTEMRARAAAEDKARTGDARSWAAALWGVAAWIQRSGLELATVWEAAGTMLIGAALFRLGILQGARTPRFYARLTVLCYGLALPLRIWAAAHAARGAEGASLAEAFGEYARLLATLGHVGIIHLLLASAAGARLLRPFVAAGRTALTLYVLQTLVTMWLLYPPWGFALYGRQGWASLMLTAFLIDAALLALAVWWTRRFAIAPVEWAWRSLTARRALPFRPA